MIVAKSLGVVNGVACKAVYAIAYDVTGWLGVPKVPGPGTMSSPDAPAAAKIKPAKKTVTKTAVNKFEASRFMFFT